MRIQTDDNLVDQWRRPRSRSRRIRRKWAKDPRNWRPSHRFIVQANTIVCHPAMAYEIKSELIARDALARAHQPFEPFPGL